MILPGIECEQINCVLASNSQQFGLDGDLKVTYHNFWIIYSMFFKHCFWVPSVKKEKFASQAKYIQCLNEKKR